MRNPWMHMGVKASPWQTGEKIKEGADRALAQTCAAAHLSVITGQRRQSPLSDIQGGWRPISSRRASKLKKRGETVEWRPELGSMAWLPGGRLPEGVVEGDEPGEYEARCRGCDEYRPIVCDLSDIPAVGYEHWCGGSPICCP